MPIGWRVQVEFQSRPELLERRYQFISTDPRDLALRETHRLCKRDAREYFFISGI